MPALRVPAGELKEIVKAVGGDLHGFNGKTILLTGGSGFLGRWFAAFFDHIAREFLERPCHLITVDNHITGPRPSHRGESVNGFKHLEHDIARPLKLDERVDIIIHAAGIASPFYYRRFPLETLDAATAGTRNMLDLAAQKQVESFVFFSSSEIYGDPDHCHLPTPESYRGNVACLGPRACYDESKRMGETLCYIYHGTRGVKTRIIRPFNVYGPGMQQDDYRVMARFASSILARQPVHIYGQGNQTRTFCYVTDAMVGFLKVVLLGVPGEAYNIGNTKPEISMLGLARLLGEVEGGPLDLRQIEYPDSYPPDEPMRRCPDLTKAGTHLGYEPRVGLKEGLGRFVAWAREHYTLEATV